VNLSRISKAIAAGIGAAVTAFGTQQAAPTAPPVWAQIVLAVAAGAVTALVTYRAPKNAPADPSLLDAP
jgi:hypothetical protein